MEQRGNYFLATMVFKSLNGLTPEYLRGIFKTNTEVHGYGTRRAIGGDLYVPPSKGNAGARTFECSGARLWNSLPQEIKMAQNLKSFKYKAKYHLLNQ